MFKVLNRVISTVIMRCLVLQIPLNLDKKINKRYSIQNGINACQNYVTTLKIKQK